MGFPMGGVWNTIYMLQVVSLVPVMRLYMPSCVKVFFDEFKFTNMENDYIATWFRKVSCSNYLIPESQAPLYTFESAGFENAQFMHNMADMLTFVVAGLCLIPLFSMLSLMIPGVMIISTADNFFRGRFLIGMINFTFMKLSFLCMLNLSAIGIYHSQSGASTFAALGALVYIAVVPMFYFF